MVVPLTANVFIAVVNALRSLDGMVGVNSTPFYVPENYCVRLLVKNLGGRMP